MAIPLAVTVVLLLAATTWSADGAAEPTTKSATQPANNAAAQSTSVDVRNLLVELGKNEIKGRFRQTMLWMPVKAIASLPLEALEAMTGNGSLTPDEVRRGLERAEATQGYTFVLVATGRRTIDYTFSPQDEAAVRNRVTAHIDAGEAIHPMTSDQLPEFVEEAATRFHGHLLRTSSWEPGQLHLFVFQVPDNDSLNTRQTGSFEVSLDADGLYFASSFKWDLPLKVFSEADR